MTGPKLAFSDKLHATKYRSKGEGFGESQDRVASALTTDPDQYHTVREIMRAMRFMGAGRVQSACGAPKHVTPYNCFVSGTIEDSFVHDEGSIMDRAKEAATTMRMGGGIGYDFSTLRPRGAMIKKLDSKSSGPITFMGIFNEVCTCTASSGNRRGAQMGVLRVDHPDIEEFIMAKQNADKLTGFNLSIAITDKFMEAVVDGTDFELVWGGETWETIDARALWEMIMRSTYNWAEPGVLFIDEINRMNNLSYCEEIVATNPCGEQPLPPFGACLLGSFNLTKYLKYVGEIQTAIPQPRYDFDYDQFKTDIPYIVRMMDRVVDTASFPLPEQQEEALSKRRMGLGYTGLANAIEAMGHPYGSSGFLKVHRKISEILRDEAYRASALLAKELGSFPLFDRDEYLKSPFVRRLPEDIQDLISEYGIRNSHLISFAPCGTISLCADNISSGVEPVQDYFVKRAIQTMDGSEVQVLEDYGHRVLGTKGLRISEVSTFAHLAVLSLSQEFADSSVSKTINLPKEIEWEDFKKVYMDAWKMKCKGCTTYRPGKRGSVIESASEDDIKEGASCEQDKDTGRWECE